MPPQNDKEELEKYYILLIIIHDWMLKSCVPIDNDVCPAPLAKLGWVIDLNLADEGQSIIDIALDHVEADLTPEKRKLCSIFCVFKKIPKWVYYFVGFLAALLTVLHLLGWLE